MGKNINVKEKKIDILATLGTIFWYPTKVEATQEEEISKSDEITDAERKELLKALDSSEKLSNKLFRNSYKTSKLEVQDLKQSAKNALKKENSDKSSTKTKNSKQDKEISEEQESKGFEISD